MYRFVLHTVVLGVLLLPLRSSARCVGEKELIKLQNRLQRRYWERLNVPQPTSPQQRAPTCAQVSKELHEDTQSRSLSPWRYRLDRNDSRFPHEIYVAECLCAGCIINRHEDHSYNSREVFSHPMVLWKTSCPGDPSKYAVRKKFIRVAVGCTCVRPVVRHAM
ncbi:interleukin-17C-like [Acanthochromis polyacanthus]|uniref:Interleukin-17C-like n=1 Tax=Acanthochromis polyacanthus TaxID=80966 RepID=A0A3Q1EF27_9TELE|nr:interleukin-17C-like [Acanthochromis polyacanthus]